MTDIAGVYEELELIEHGHQWFLKKGFSPNLKKKVLLKIVRSQSNEDAARLYHEYKVSSDLPFSWVLKPIAFENYGDKSMLVTENFDGISLNQMLKEKTFSVYQFLLLGIDLTNILIGLEQQRIIFKHFNPKHILINKESWQIKMTGFEYATFLRKENNHSLENPYMMKYQIPYLSPEQTGRMNRSLDHRSDLYTLGVIFYEMLMGFLPFQDKEPSELIHSILAKTPSSPNQLNHKIPAMISRIVMKLLSKNPEERYQSAIGLKEDLVKCLEKITTDNTIPNFILAENDQYLDLELIEAIYGRDKDLTSLSESLERIYNGSKEIVFISGSAGVGKTAFVREIQKLLLNKKGYFTAGKFDQLKGDHLFAPIVQAFRDLLRQVYVEGEQSIQRLRKKILMEIVSIPKEFVELLPEILWYADEIKVETSDDKDNLERQQMIQFTFQRLIEVFTKMDHTLILFLDDLQWADIATLEMLEKLIVNHLSGPFMIIGAFRDNEIHQNHPLMLFRESMEKEGMQIEEILLRSLKADDVHKWVSDTLKTNGEISIYLSQLLHNVTGGNPFYLKQLLSSFYKDGVLTYDYNDKEWKFNLDRDKLSSINEDIIEFIIRKMEKLPDECKFLLRLASCIGNRFSFEILQTSIGKPALHIFECLDILLREGFILPLDPNYKWVHSYEMIGVLNEYAPRYMFFHDRIQQAVYVDMDEKEREQFHITIGRLLVQHFHNNLSDEAILEIVKHFNFCLSKLTDEETKCFVDWNFRLGNKAKSSAAFQTALNFYRKSIELLPKNHWQEHYSLSLQLYTNLGECEYLNSDFEAAEASFNTALHHAKTNYEKLEIYNLKIQLYTHVQRVTEAVETGIKGLNLFQIKVKAKPSKLDVLIEYLLAKKKLGRNPSTLLEMPKMESKEKRLILQTLVNMNESAYHYDPNLTAVISIKSFRYTLTHGHEDLSAPIYITYALILSAGFGEYKNSHEIGKIAIQYAEKSGNKYLIGWVYFVYGTFISPWKISYEQTIYFIKKSQQYSLETGRFSHLGAASSFVIAIHWMKGSPLQEVIAEINRQLSLVDAIQYKLSKNYIIEVFSWVKLFIDTKEVPNWNPIDFGEDHSTSIMHLTIRLQSSYLLENEVEFYKLNEALQENIKNTPTLVVTPQYYFYSSLWMTKLYSKEKNYEYDKKLKKHLAKLKKWGKLAPMNYLHLYTLIKAEYCRVKRKDNEAELLYDRAIKLASLNGFIQDKAIANECAARYYFQKGEQKIAGEYLSEAIRDMKKWGALRIVEEWGNKYNLSNMAEELSSSLVQPISIDVKTLLDTTQSLSEDIRMDQLLKKMLSSLIENVGASNGIFLKNIDGEMLIIAKGDRVNDFFETYQGIPIDNYDHIPQSVIQYVLRSQEPVLLNNAKESGMFTKDPYIQHSYVKSILCLPVHYQGRLTAILYMENNVTSYAFTLEKIELIKVISAQIAISVENAKMYLDLEEIVKERTAELNNANENLLQVNEKLERSEIARKQLFSNISHDLRTPIASALGYIDAILDGVVTDSNKQAFYLKRSKERLLSLNNLLQDLFHLAKLDVGRVAFKFEVLQVKQLFRHLSNKYETDVKNAGLQYDVILSEKIEDNIYVEVDLGRIEQVFMNLMQNAIKYTKKGFIKLILIINEGHVCISIKDSGIGIPDKQLPFIFDHFFGAGNHSVVDSHGLGLSICKGIITQHNGEIWVESVEGEGSVFTFKLPLVKSTVMIES